MENYSTTRRPCAPRARCRRWRECETCARIRQAQIADAAQRLAAIQPQLHWACIQPDQAGPQALAAARAAFLRAADPPGAIWTVEQSPETGRLHCNVITPTLPGAPMRAARLWSAPIAGEVRAVAAYIAKRDQMPDRTSYPGRLYGTAGPLWQWLSDPRQDVITQAAAVQYDLDQTVLATGPTHAERYRHEIAEPSWAEYRQIAARRLADLMPPAGRRAMPTANAVAQIKRSLNDPTKR